MLVNMRVGSGMYVRLTRGGTARGDAEMLTSVRAYGHKSESLASLTRVTLPSRTRVKAGSRSGAQHMCVFILVCM